MTGSRIIVAKEIYNFIAKFTEKVSAIKYGNPREPGVVVGPLIRDSQAGFITEQIDGAVEQGARLLCGGVFDGNVFQQTVLADVTQQMSVFYTECFGPCASVIKAEDSGHALELANDSEYGLSSAVLTNDIQEILKFTEGLEAGMCHVNGATLRDEPVVLLEGKKTAV